MLLKSVLLRSQGLPLATSLYTNCSNENMLSFL